MVINGQWRNIGVTAAGLGLLLASGCATRPTSANEAFDKNPLSYHRVQLLPVIVTPTANTNETLTTDEVWQINTSIASNLVYTLCHSLQTYGFDVAEPQTILACPKDWTQLTESCASNVVAVRHELAETSRTIWRRLQHTSVKLGDFQITNATAFACADGMVSNIDAIVVMNSIVFVESRMERNKRRGELALENTLGILAALGGVGFTTWRSSPSGVQTTVAIIDTKTSNVLWWNSWRFADVNLSDTNAIAHTVTSMIAHLPPGTQQPSSR